MFQVGQGGVMFVQGLGSGDFSWGKLITIVMPYLWEEEDDDKEEEEDASERRWLSQTLPELHDYTKAGILNLSGEGGRLDG